MTLRPQNNLFEGKPMNPRSQDRVRDNTGTDVEGVPAEEGIDAADVEERLDKDPEEQPNATDVGAEGEADLTLAERDPDRHAEDR